MQNTVMKTVENPNAKIAPVVNLKKDAARVIVVDDHPLMRKGVSQLIEQEKDLTVVGEAEDAPKAITVIEKNLPDVV